MKGTCIAARSQDNRKYIYRNLVFSIAGCEFIVSISIFECQLCEVFLRHQNDIEQHIETVKHLESYKVKTFFAINL